MNIVIDTNIFIAALIRDSMIRKILTKISANFLFPEFEFEEIKKHKLEILQKSKLSEKELDILILRALNYVKVLPSEIIVEFREDARFIMDKIDSNDSVFIASALAFDAVIWSDDKHFKKQNKVKVYTTKEIIKIFDITN